MCVYERLNVCIRSFTIYVLNEKKNVERFSDHGNSKTSDERRTFFCPFRCGIDLSKNYAFSRPLCTANRFRDICAHSVDSERVLDGCIFVFISRTCDSARKQYRK